MESVITEQDSMSVIAKQDIHWDRIPVDGNLMRFQFRCLVQSTEDCTSWQNPVSFKRHMEKMHNMKPEATRRGRPPTKKNNGKGRSPAKTDDGKSRICLENLADRSSGDYPYKWWIRKKYQLGSVVRKIVKQMQLKGIQEESKVIHKALECYGRWRDSEKALAVQKKLAESTMVYWMEKGLSKEEARVKGKVPFHLQQEVIMENARVELPREPEPDVVYRDGGYKIIRRNPPVNEGEHEEGASESDGASDGKEASDMVEVTENGFNSEDAGEVDDAGEKDEVQEKGAAEEEKTCKEEDRSEGKMACDEEKICEEDDAPEGRNAREEEKTCEEKDAGEGNNAREEEKTCEKEDAGEDLGDLTRAEEGTTRVESTYTVVTVVCIQRHCTFAPPPL